MTSNSDHTIPAPDDISRQVDESLGLVQVSTRVSTDLKATLKKIARMRKVPIQAVIRQALEEYVTRPVVIFEDVDPGEVQSLPGKPKNTPQPLAIANLPERLVELIREEVRETRLSTCRSLLAWEICPATTREELIIKYIGYASTMFDLKSDIESEFGVSLSNEEWGQWADVKELVSLIESHLKGTSS